MNGCDSEFGNAMRREDFVVGFDEARILRRMGVRKKPSGADPAILALIREEATGAALLLRPAAVAAVVPASDIEPHPVFHGAVRVALCICTIGPGIETRATRVTAEGDLLRGLVLDALGTDAVSTVSKASVAWTRGLGRSLGLWPSKRYAPGYKGWDVTAQKIFFDRLPALEIGVSLTESFMMVPRKSYSFRINFCEDPAMIRKGT